MNSKGFLWLLLLALIILKLTGFINWSWWVVVFPLYIKLGLFIMAILIVSVNNVLEKQNINPTKIKSRFQTKLDEMMAEAEKQKENE